MKTIENTIRWLKNIRDDAAATLDHIRLWEPDVKTTLYKSRKEKAEIALRALKHTQWIPVQERLPEDNTEVAVTIDGGGEIGTFVSSDYHSGGQWQYWNGVIAWMPLPEPYKAAEQEDHYENITSQ